jgi:hypothetical protein
MIAVGEFERLKIGCSLVGMHDLWNGTEYFLDVPLIKIVSIRSLNVLLSR